MSNQTEYPQAVDVVGYNYTENRYDEDHATYPDRVIYGSETGVGIEAWHAVRDKEFIFGQFLWRVRTIWVNQADGLPEVCIPVCWTLAASPNPVDTSVLRFGVKNL
jgi:hypothetical protein